MRTLSWLLPFALFIGGCAPASTIGKTGEWITGKTLSVNAAFISSSSPGRRLMLDVRNDSNEAVSILPVKATGWFEKAGRLESESSPGLMSASFAVRSREGGTRSLTVDPKALNLILQPGESAQVGSLVYWDQSKVRFDQLKRARIFLGRDGAEVFTIE